MQLTASPSKYGSENSEFRYSATEVLPHPAGPVITHMCLCTVAVVRPRALLVFEDIFARLWVEGSDGGVGGRCCSGILFVCMIAADHRTSLE